MGKLTLLLVMGAIIGGSLLSIRARNIAEESQRDRSELTHDVLARDAATSGHGLVLNAMIGTDGFRSSLGFTEHQTRDGAFEVTEYQTTADRQEVTFSITGHSGGATHTIRSTYEWDPMTFPGPLWLDVPYVTADVEPGAEIGDDGGKPVHIDDRRFHDLNLSSLLSYSTMRTALQGTLAGAGGTTSLISSDMLTSGYLDDLNVADATDLYFAAINAITAGDVTETGPYTVTSNQNYGPDYKIVRVTGNLVIDGARLEGKGALVVEGDLMLIDDGRLIWDGLVIVHSEENYAQVLSTDGRIDIDGALVVDQLAVPPGGHMDMTVMRDLDGSWSSPGGSPSSIWGSDFPWYQHKHRFDIEVPEVRTVYFAEDGADRHEEWTQFRDALTTLGSEEVYIEIYNENRHGYADYTLDIAGQPQVYTGAVKNGFGLFSALGDVHRTQPFEAQDLETFIVDVRSLRMLQRRFDGVGACDQWPFCIGEEWWRGGGLTVRLRKASNNARLYEATLYWHMRSDEVAEHALNEQALRDAIEAGTAFGTRLEFGDNVKVNFDIDEIAQIGHRLGFDGDEMINRGTWTYHMSPDDYRAMGVEPPSGPGGGGGGASQWICHAPGTPLESLVNVDVSALAGHLLHGDLLNSCP